MALDSVPEINPKQEINEDLGRDVIVPRDPGDDVIVPKDRPKNSKLPEIPKIEYPEDFKIDPE